MFLYDNDLYMEDVHSVSDLELPWEKLENRNIMVSGATGLLGSFFTDVILEKNRRDGLNCRVYLLGRDERKAKNRFYKYADDPNYAFILHDVNTPYIREDPRTIDYVLHLASNTHPIQYSSDPIGTITTNIIGLNNMLETAVTHDAARFLFASSNEIYGENRGDTEKFNEEYCGYINCNTMRACYPESKRCGEALCQAYKSQKNLDVVISRFTRSYGPTMLMSDTKAISQFIKNGAAGKDIVLKSAGNQYYSYTYVADAVSGLMTVLLSGSSGEAYNIADEDSDITLKDLAAKIAEVSKVSVVYEEPDKKESAGYSKATKARLDGEKLKKLGWTPRYNIQSGIERTIRVLRSMNNN